ncbi:MAG: peptide chain release factor N(5)-glutamine methyltransferase [Bacilli bacterium]|nr:peptide chain release factor N(5)-glutamine methyltransferase [Bacilli bacterium]
MTDIEYLKKYGEYTKENIEKINMGIPIQYIVGNVLFYDSIIEINENTLIPRFETEELVDYTIKKIKNKFNNIIDIVDLGTGSGCIAITIKKHIDCNIDAIDISSSALEQAKINAIKNNTIINFINNNMLDNINKQYDVIISNPPYIAIDEEIDEKVKKYEPEIALYATNNGLYYYEYILKNISKNLKENYIIAFEIGYRQANDIINLIKKYLNNSIYEVKKDMEGKDRFIFIENKN